MAEFDEYADDYQDLLDDALRASGEGAEYFHAYKAHALRRLLGAEEPARVLDYGCGVGMVTRHITEAFGEARVDGFDVSSESIGRVPESLRGRGLFTHELDELGRDYDLITISNVLHHIPPAQRRGVMRDLGERLAPGGRLVIFEHNPLNPVTRRVVAMCAFDEDAILLWPAESEGLLVEAGLEEVTKSYILFFPAQFAFLRGLEPALAWCPLGAQYMAWGRAR